MRQKARSRILFDMIVIEYVKKAFGFVRKNPGILSSLVLLVVIPVALYYNVKTTVDAFTRNIDEIVQSQVFAAEKMLGVFVTEYTEKEELQEKINAVMDANPDIEFIEITGSDREGYAPIASMVREGQQMSTDTEKKMQDLSAIAWNKNADGIGFDSNDGGLRQWNVIKPLHNKEGEAVGLIRMAMSVSDADELSRRAQEQAYYVLFGVIILVLILIINHTRMFQYAVLFGKLQEIDKMKDDFISMAAHELKTPVVVMKGYAELLQQAASKLTEEQRTDRLRMIVSYADNLMTLISDILDVSRIEQGRLVLEMSDESPYPMIQEVVDTIRDSAEQKGLVLEYENKEVAEPAVVAIDTKRLRQVLINLIGNSIKYTEKGTVQVITKVDKIHKRFVLIIEDTGLGMSAIAQRSLFQKFYRVKTEHTEHISGTGLGLWITKAICEQMDGDISVESMEGVGSKFTITFPYKEAKKEIA